MRKVLFALLAFIAFAAIAQAQFADQRQYAASTGGSANAQTVNVPNYALDVGVAINFRASFTNNAATTINVNGTGNVPVKRQTPGGLAALVGGEIVSGQIAQVFFDGAQFQLLNPANVASIWGGTSTGSGNAQIVTALTAYAGQQITFRAGFTNTGATTLNGVAVNKDTTTGPTALTGGEIYVGNIVSVAYDATLSVYHILNLAPSNQTFATLASAATTDLGTAGSPNISVTGVTTINSFGSSALVTAPLYNVTFTGALTLTYNATSLILPGGANITTAANDYAELKYLGSGNWQVISYTPAAQSPNAPPLPTGRLTLTTGVPVLSSAVSAATTIYYTPYAGATIPLWTGSGFVSTPFSELSQLLSDATKSPAAAVANSVYDVFVWNDAGTLRATRGLVWTNATTRAAAIGRVQGVLVNSVSVTNGPAAGYGTYVGTIATDAGGATVTFNPTPAAASGGPTNGAWVGLWNQYNRKQISALAQDNKASWTSVSVTWVSLDGATNNRVTFVSGNAEDSVFCSVQTFLAMSVGGSNGNIGIGLDSTTAAFAMNAVANGSNFVGIAATGATLPQLGQHYVQALQSVSGGTATYNGTVAPSANITQVTASVNY